MTGLESFSPFRSGPIDRAAAPHQEGLGFFDAVDGERIFAHGVDI
jgi:hypothetical protein